MFKDTLEGKTNYCVARENTMHDLGMLRQLFAEQEPTKNYTAKELSEIFGRIVPLFKSEDMRKIFNGLFVKEVL